MGIVIMGIMVWDMVGVIIKDIYLDIIYLGISFKDGYFNLFST